MARLISSDTTALTEVMARVAVSAVMGIVIVIMLASIKAAMRQMGVTTTLGVAALVEIGLAAVRPINRAHIAQSLGLRAIIEGDGRDTMRRMDVRLVFIVAGEDHRIRAGAAIDRVMAGALIHGDGVIARAALDGRAAAADDVVGIIVVAGKRVVTGARDERVVRAGIRRIGVEPVVAFGNAQSLIVAGSGDQSIMRVLGAAAEQLALAGTADKQAVAAADQRIRALASEKVIMAASGDQKSLTVGRRAAIQGVRARAAHHGRRARSRMNLVIAAIRAGKEEVVALPSIDRRSGMVSGEEKIPGSTDNGCCRIPGEPDIGRSARRIDDRIIVRVDTVDACVVDDKEIDAWRRRDVSRRVYDVDRNLGQTSKRFFDGV